MGSCIEEAFQTVFSYLWVPVVLLGDVSCFVFWGKSNRTSDDIYCCWALVMFWLKCLWLVNIFFCLLKVLAANIALGDYKWWGHNKWWVRRTTILCWIDYSNSIAVLLYVILTMVIPSWWFNGIQPFSSCDVCLKLQSCQYHVQI